MAESPSTRANISGPFHPTNGIVHDSFSSVKINTVLVQVIEIVRARGSSVVEPDSYEAVLREPLERRGRLLQQQRCTTCPRRQDPVSAVQDRGNVI
jgi:hypothetical protein